MENSPNSIGPVNEEFRRLETFPTFTDNPIEDDFELLNLLVADSAQSHMLWQPTRYWASYAGRIVDAINERGLSKLRQENEILSGYQVGDASLPTMPVAPWKRVIWNLIQNAPLVSNIISEYRHANEANHAFKRRAINGLAMCIFNQVADKYSGFTVPHHTSGYPNDLILWRGQYVSAAWADYLLRVADLYDHISPNEVNSFIEIGPGLGWTTVSHIALNSNIKLGVNVDISPVLYVSSQFLKSVSEIDVIDYRATKDLDKIILKPGTDKPRIYQIAPWQLPKLEGQLDIFANAFSFYEMEKDICENYIDIVKPLVKKAIHLHASITGKTLEHGPREEISLDFLVDQFSDKFPDRESLNYGWNEIYGRFSTAVTILKAADFR